MVTTESNSTNKTIVDLHVLNTLKSNSKNHWYYEDAAKVVGELTHLYPDALGVLNALEMRAILAGDVEFIRGSLRLKSELNKEAQAMTKKEKEVSNRAIVAKGKGKSTPKAKSMQNRTIADVAKKRKVMLKGVGASG